MANIRSFPNNQDEYIGAEDVMRWHHGRTSGVFGAENNASVAPVLDAMAVTVSDGIGWLSNAKNNGIVWWVDSEAKNGEKLRLSVDMADAVLARIDRVVVSWQTTNYVALPEVIILKGTPAGNPVAPALTNDSLVRQISLARIRIPAGATAIDASMITDERLDASVCGIVTEKVSVDTSTMQAQFEAFWANNVAAFEAYMAQQKDACEENAANFEAYMEQQRAAWEAFFATTTEISVVPVPSLDDKGKAVLVNENGDGYKLEEIQTEIPVTSTPTDDTELWIDPDDENDVVTPEGIGAAPAIESEEHPGCYFRIVDGVTEWINPPTVPGVEYRTTERWSGKVVYTQIIDCGLSANGKTIMFPEVILTNIRYAAKIGGQLLPVLTNNDPAADWSAHMSVGTRNAVIYCGSSLTNIQTCVQIWYIKGDA